ncbi:MAG: hypothetical protein PHH11_15745 [Methylomonas sp.]|nr:hypothetical protein [Methylomonas sp.]
MALVAVAFGISNYFNSRKTDEPSRIEAVAAFTWLLIRRVVCFTAAFIFAAAAIGMLFDTDGWAERLVRSGLSLMMAVFFGWVGVYGQGWNRYKITDDLALHRKNKDRYKWRW